MTTALLIYSASGVIALYGLVLAWRHRWVRGGRWLVWLMVVMCVWMFSNALLHVPFTREMRVFWAQVSSVGTFQAPLWLMFALDYCLGERRVRRWESAVIVALPILLVVAAFTNPVHGWFWRSIVPVGNGSGILRFSPGWLYAAMVLVGLAMFIAGAVVFLSMAIRTRGPQRRQGILVVLGMGIEAGAYASYLGSGEWPAGLYPAMTAGVAAGFIAFAIQRYRLLELVPVGREEMIASMPDAFLVSDQFGRIVDSNPAARVMLAGVGELTGKKLADALTGWCGGEVLDVRDLSQEIAGELRRPDGRVIDARAWPLRVPGGEIVGRAVMLRDVTGSRQAHESLERAASSVASWVREMDSIETLLGRRDGTA